MKLNPPKARKEESASAFSQGMTFKTHSTFANLVCSKQARISLACENATRSYDVCLHFSLAGGA